MELVPKPFHGSKKRYWRRRQYHKLDKEITSSRKNINVKAVKLHGGGSNKLRRFWKIKTVPKLRLKMNIVSSPLKLIWSKFKNAYMDAMLNLAGNVGYLNTENTFGARRIPKARQIQVKYSGEEIEERLVYEIYKALVASRELSTI